MLNDGSYMTRAARALEIASGGGGGGGRGTPLYELYWYVRPQKVWFFSRFGHKLGIELSHFGNKKGIDFCTLVLNLCFFLEKVLLHHDVYSNCVRAPTACHTLGSRGF